MVSICLYKILKIKYIIFTRNVSRDLKFLLQEIFNIRKLNCIRIFYFINFLFIIFIFFSRLDYHSFLCEFIRDLCGKSLSVIPFHLRFADKCIQHLNRSCDLYFDSCENYFVTNIDLL